MEINKRKTSLYRVFGCLLALALAWGALPALAEVTHGVVTGDKVLFRKEITGSDFWDRLDRGWVARVLDESKSGGYTWYKVETNIPVAKNRTYTGYIRGDFFRMLTQEEETAWLVNKPQPDPSLGGAAGDPPEKTAAPDSAPDGEATGTLTITKKSTNLRREPGGTSLFQYPIGEVLNYYGAPVFSGGYGWAYVIDSARGLRGYVRSDCYSLDGGSWTTTPPDPTETPSGGPDAASVRITLGGTNLREFPGGSVVAVLSRGRVLPFYGSPTAYGGYNWVYVYDDVSRKYGYVRSDCYEFAAGAPVPTPTPTPGPDVPAMGSLTLIKGGVNLRNAPGGLTIAQLDRGLVLSYTKFVQKDGYTWYLVNSPKGTGYVRSDVVQLGSGGETPPPDAEVTPPASMLGYIVTIKSEINLREKPQAGAGIIGRVDKGRVLPLQGPVQTSNGYNWFEVNVDGRAGFLRGDCMRQMNNAEVADWLNYGTIPALTPPSKDDPPPATGYVLTLRTSVNVRATASLDARALGQAADAGTAFPLLGTQTAGGRLWYKIRYQEQEGYVLGSLVRMMTQEEYLAYIAALPSPTPTPTPTPPPSLDQMSRTAVTTMNKVIVRSGAGSSNNNLLLIYKKGTVVSLLGQTGTVGTEIWYSVRASGVNGWIRGDLLRILTPKEEEALKNTGDPDAPSTASYRTLQLGSTGEDVLRLNQELNRLGYLQNAYVSQTYSSQTAEAVRDYQRAKGLTVDGIAGSNTQHKLYNTVPEGTYDPGGSTVNPTIYPVELVDWYKGDINAFWGRGETAIMTDVRTNISLRIRRWAGGYHVDGEPLTSADTAALTRIYGVKTAQEILEKNLYQRRPVWITLKGRSFAASLYGVPHNYPDGDTIPNNDFNGQLCIHFYNSRVHVSGKVDKDHMNAIQYAYDHAPSRKK